MFTTPELDNAVKIIDGLITIAPFPASRYADVDFAQKLDRLSELIDVLRYHQGIVKRGEDRHVFQPTSIHADTSNGTLHFTASDQSDRAAHHRTPNLLVLPLLEFLHEHPGDGKPVLEIIHDFIQHHLKFFHIVDFARTSTGVLRAETNVRFAAKILRENGMLQYTQDEAFKTWRLSLVGILAAVQPPDKPPLSGYEGVVPMWREVFFSRLAPLVQTDQLVERLKLVTEHTEAQQWVSSPKFLALAAKVIEEYRSTLAKTRSELLEQQKARILQPLLQELNATPEAENIVRTMDRRKSLPPEAGE